MRQSKRTNKQQPPPAPCSFASVCMLDIRNSCGGEKLKQKVLDVGKRLICSHQVSCCFSTLCLSPPFFWGFLCASAHTPLKVGSRNSLGQPFHCYLSQFLVQHLLLLLQNRKIFLLAQVMQPLVDTPWFRQPFTSWTPMSVISRRVKTLCVMWVMPPPAQKLLQQHNSTSWLSGAMSNPHHLPLSVGNATCNSCSSHKGFYRGFSLPSCADLHTIHTHWYSSLWPLSPQHLQQINNETGRWLELGCITEKKSFNHLNHTVLTPHHIFGYNM